MLKIGLTGGIGSGKSAATARFAELGAPIIDADITARKVVETGSPGLLAIEQRFGSSILNKDGALNRDLLRDLVFSDDKARSDLESILHPRIRQHMWQQLAQLDDPYAILDIPLLFETKQNQQMDRVVVVDCPRELQIERICNRDHISAADAAAIIRAQISREERLKGAHDIIDNSGTLLKLTEQVDALHISYLELAKNEHQ